MKEKQEESIQEEYKKPRGCFVPFGKKEYTLREIVKRVAESYDIIITEKNKKTKRMKTNRTYDNLYQTIKRKLDEKVIDEEGEELQSSKGRKTTYPVEYINQVINDELGPYFIEFASKKREEELAKYEEKAKQYEREFKNGTHGDSIAKLNEGLISPEPELNLSVFKSLEHYKHEILMDIVFNHLIILDEDKLINDLSVEFTADDATPSARELEAMDRLTNYRNYYRWRTEGLDDLLDSAHQK